MEELFLGAVLVVEELDVVDQQQVERAVALEDVEALLLVGPHHVGVVVLGVHIADHRARITAEDLVADGVDEVGLAEAHAAVYKQRVVGRAGILRDLHGGRAARSLARPVTRLLKVKSRLRRVLS